MITLNIPTIFYALICVVLVVLICAQCVTDATYRTWRQDIIFGSEHRLKQLRAVFDSVMDLRYLEYDRMRNPVHAKYEKATHSRWTPTGLGGLVLFQILNVFFATSSLHYTICMVGTILCAIMCTIGSLKSHHSVQYRVEDAIDYNASVDHQLNQVYTDFMVILALSRNKEDMTLEEVEHLKELTCAVQDKITERWKKNMPSDIKPHLPSEAVTKLASVMAALELNMLICESVPDAKISSLVSNEVQSFKMVVSKISS